MQPSANRLVVAGSLSNIPKHRIVTNAALRGH
jgi:hypothetical protein